MYETDDSPLDLSMSGSRSDRSSEGSCSISPTLKVPSLDTRYSSSVLTSSPGSHGDADRKQCEAEFAHALSDASKLSPRHAALPLSAVRNPLGSLGACDLRSDGSSEPEMTSSPEAMDRSASDENSACYRGLSPADDALLWQQLRAKHDLLAGIERPFGLPALFYSDKYTRDCERAFREANPYAYDMKLPFMHELIVKYARERAAAAAEQGPGFGGLFQHSLIPGLERGGVGEGGRFRETFLHSDVSLLPMCSDVTTDFAPISPPKSQPGSEAKHYDGSSSSYTAKPTPRSRAHRCKSQPKRLEAAKRHREAASDAESLIDVFRGVVQEPLEEEGEGQVEDREASLVDIKQSGNSQTGNISTLDEVPPAQPVFPPCDSFYRPATPEQQVSPKAGSEAGASAISPSSSFETELMQPDIKRPRLSKPGGCGAAKKAAKSAANQSKQGDGSGSPTTESDSPATDGSTANGGNAATGKRTRPKRGQYRKYNHELLVEAVRAVQRGEMSVHRAGSYYGVPHSTLEYKVKERHLLRQRKPREPRSNAATSDSAATKKHGTGNSTAVDLSAAGAKGDRSSTSNGAQIEGGLSMAEEEGGASVAGQAGPDAASIHSSLFMSSLTGTGGPLGSLPGLHTPFPGLPHSLASPLGLPWSPAILAGSPALGNSKNPSHPSMLSFLAGLGGNGASSASELLKKLQAKVQADIFGNGGNSESCDQLEDQSEPECAMMTSSKVTEEMKKVKN